jgi:glycosyltransferase involved in cell wall biosynthesis
MSPPPRHRPRILMTADAVGGVWTYATSLARELCAQGFEITLVTLGPPPRSDQLLDIAGIDGLLVETTDLALEWMDPDAQDLPRALAQLAAIEQRVRPDVVHLNGFREATGEWNAPVIVVAHSCVRSWWVACRGGEASEPRWVEYIANVQRGLASATCWVAPTYAFRDTIESLYEPPTHGRVIWNGTNRLAASARSTSGPKQPFILAAGRLWDEAKNIAALGNIANHLPWRVRVAGSLAPHGGIESAPLSGVERLGELTRDGLREEMTRAAIFVAPALYEPFGLTVLEAAQAGCALMLSDQPSFRELWDGAATFVDPHNETALQEALLQLIGDDAKRRELQRRAVRRAERYSLAAMSENYAALYDEVAQRRAPRMVQHKYAGAAP